MISPEHRMMRLPAWQDYFDSQLYIADLKLALFRAHESSINISDYNYV